MSFSRVLLLLVLCSVAVPATTIQVGVPARFASSAADYSANDETYTNFQMMVGLAAAFHEANVAQKLGVGNSITVAPSNIGTGDGTSQVAALQAQGVTVLALASPTAVPAAIATGVPLVGARSGANDYTTLYAANQRHVINIRYPFSTEYSTMINFALNSRLRCRRFGIAFPNSDGMPQLATGIQSILTGLGLTVTSVAFVRGTGYSPIQALFNDPATTPQCVFLLADHSEIPGLIASYESHPSFNAADTFYLIADAAYHPRLASLNSRLYVLQQIPNPTDASFQAVAQFQSALSAFVLAGGLTSLPSGVYGAVNPQANYPAMEGYLVGRLIVEVFARTNLVASTAHGASFLNTLYSSKFISVGELTFGPYSDGCQGRQASTDIPCWCTAGNKLLYMTKANPTANQLQPVPESSSLGEFNLAVKAIPTVQCGPSFSGGVSIPFTFLQIRNTSLPTRIRNRQLAFHALTQALFFTLNEAFGGRAHILIDQDIDFASSSAPAQLQYAMDRYPSMAMLGSVLNRGELERMDVEPSILTTYIVQDMPLTDPPLSDWSRAEIFIAPVLAEFIHSAAEFTSQEWSGEPVQVYGTTQEEIDLAIRSLSTFGVTSITEVLIPVSADLPTTLAQNYPDNSGVAFIVTRDVLALYYSVQFAMTRQNLRLVIAADEGYLETVIRHPTISLSSHNIYFASALPPFFDPTDRSVTMAGSFYRTSGARPGQIVVDLIFSLKTFRMIVFLFAAGSGLSATGGGSDFVNNIYNRRTIQVFDESFGSFNDDECEASTVQANTAERACQCSKAIREVYVHSLTDWELLTPTASVRTSFVQRMPPDQCGIVYGDEEATSFFSGMNLYLIAGGGGALLIILVVILLLACGGKKRNVKYAPKDTTKPFAIAFTDIQSSTNLWARAPQAMGPAVDIHHELIRKVIAKRKGYEVKTVGDSFMVAFANPSNAILFASDVQEALHKYDWSPEIDRVYRELEAEKREAEAVASGSTKLEDPKTEDASCWNGIRVRIGLHYGIGEVKLDEVSLGYDYYGTVVNTAARIEAAGHGGQIVISQALFEAVAGENAVTLGLEGVSSKPLGPALLRGLDTPLDLYQVTPECLSKRVFGPLRLDVEQADSSSDTEDAGPADDTKSIRSVRSHASAASSIGGTRVTPAEITAEKFGRRWKREGHGSSLEGFRHAIRNFACMKALFSVTNGKFRDQTMQHLALKWRVQLAASTATTKDDEAISNHQLMQLVVKMTPAADAVAKEYLMNQHQADADLLMDVESPTTTGPSAFSRVTKFNTSGTSATSVSPPRSPTGGGGGSAHQANKYLK